MTVLSLSKETDFINHYLQSPSKEFSLIKLKGDASERKYYRVLFNDHSPSIILMVPSLEQEKESQKNYLEIQRLLSSLEVSVPKIYACDKATHQILLEDFGDTLLFNRIKKDALSDIKILYQKALDQVLTIQSAHLKKEASCHAFSLRFDTKKLLWELNFFLIHTQNIKRKIKKDDLKFIENEFKNICDILSSEETVFTHRDYHSKNLLIQQNDIKIIDFQDARMGPYQYDLVSLLKDAYADLDEKLICELIDYYLSKKEQLEGNKIDRKHFFYIFDLMTFQRSLKACGTFSFLYREKQKKEYMEFFPIALDYAKKSIVGKKEYQRLHETLFPYFE